MKLRLLMTALLVMALASSVALTGCKKKEAPAEEPAATETPAEEADAAAAEAGAAADEAGAAADAAEGAAEKAEGAAEKAEDAEEAAH